LFENSVAAAIQGRPLKVRFAGVVGQLTWFSFAAAARLEEKLRGGAKDRGPINGGKGMTTSPIAVRTELTRLFAGLPAIRQLDEILRTGTPGR